LVERLEHDAHAAAADHFDDLVMTEPAQMLGIVALAEKAKVRRVWLSLRLCFLPEGLLHDLAQGRAGWSFGREALGLVVPRIACQLVQRLLACFAAFDMPTEGVLLRRGERAGKQLTKPCRVGAALLRHGPGSLAPLG